MSDFYNKYPYTDFHELNLDYILEQMKLLRKAFEDFVGINTITFADPILWSITKEYNKNEVVLDNSGNAYLSLQIIPAGIPLTNTEYWMEIFNFTGFISAIDSNITFNIEANTDKATADYVVDDWLLIDNVLYKVTATISEGDTFIIGTNIERFTLEQYIKAWISSCTQLINQYKYDIDESELQYRNQLAQDIADTTASLQAQLDAAISGATVDSEVINARIGADGVTYPTLGDAIRTQFDNIGNKWEFAVSARYEFTGTSPTPSISQIYFPNAFFFAGDIIEIYFENVTPGMINNSATVYLYDDATQIAQFFPLTRSQFVTLTDNTDKLSVYVPNTVVDTAGSYKVTLICYNRHIGDHFADLIGSAPKKIAALPVATFHADTPGNTLTAVQNGCVSHCVVTATGNIYTIAFGIKQATGGRFAIRANTNIDNVNLITAYLNNNWSTNSTFFYEGNLSKGNHYFDFTDADMVSRRYIIIRFNGTGTYDFDYYMSYQDDNGFDIPAEIFAYHAEKADEADHLKDTSYNKIVFWGDSITAGTGTTPGNPNFVEKCCSLLNVDEYTNAGVGGETSWTIAARQGGSVVYLPAGDVSASTYSLRDRNGNPVRPLEQGYLMGGGPPRYSSTVIVNGVSGTLTRNATDDYSISASTILDHDTPLIFPGAILNFKIAVIFVGTNDWNASRPLESIPYVQTMVNKQKIYSDYYIVMSQYRDYNATYEQAMLDTFGCHYFNTRKMLIENGLDINGITPTAADTAAIAAGNVPPSLLADAIHLNDAGHNALGIMLYEHFVFKLYIYSVVYQ